MKPADLQDIVIMQDTTTLAFKTFVETLGGEGSAMAVSFSWMNIKDCTKDMTADIATVVVMLKLKMDETYSITYLKYTN